MKTYCNYDGEIVSHVALTSEEINKVIKFFNEFKKTYDKMIKMFGDYCPEMYPDSIKEMRTFYHEIENFINQNSFLPNHVISVYFSTYLFLLSLLTDKRYFEIKEIKESFKNFMAKK